MDYKGLEFIGALVTLTSAYLTTSTYPYASIILGILGIILFVVYSLGYINLNFKIPLKRNKKEIENLNIRLDKFEKLCEGFRSGLAVGGRKEK